MSQTTPSKPAQTSTPPVVTVADALAGRVPVGSPVRVQGWLRTRRDSKAGLSFLHVHDGSCFDPLQVVAAGTLPNYETELVRLTAGCAVVVEGELVASEGKGQAVEVQATSVEVVGWVDDPDTYPIAAKRHSFERTHRDCRACHLPSASASS